MTQIKKSFIGMLFEEEPEAQVGFNKNIRLKFLIFLQTLIFNPNFLKL